jgi:hypothetical protein
LVCFEVLSFESNRFSLSRFKGNNVMGWVKSYKHMVHKRAFSLAITGAIAIFGGGCNQEAYSDGSLASNRSALSNNDARVLGFESVGDWSVTNGTATVASGTSHIEGAASLAVSQLGYVELTSGPLSSLAVNDGSISIDLQLPSVQPNPYWYGQLQMFVNCPSINIYNRYVGAQELTGLPLATFNRIAMVLPSDVTAAFAQSHDDLRLKIVLNVPQNSGTYFLDRLQLNSKDGTGGTGGASSTGGSSSLSVSISLPDKIKPETVLLVASDDLKLADRVNVVRNGPTTIVNAGTAETNIGVEAQVGTVWSAGPIVMRDRAVATGNVTTKSTLTQWAGAVVQGTITENASVRPNDTIDWSVPISGTNLGQRDVQPDQTQPLDPGRYGPVSVKPRATLSLRSGTYFMDSLTVEPESHLDINETGGPVIVYVMGDLIFRGVGAAQDGDLNSFLVVVLGSGSQAIDSTFDGTLIAPNGTIVLATVSGTHKGAFFGKHIEVRPDAVFQLRPYAHWDAFYSPDDANGGTNGPIPLPDTPAGQAIREHLTIFGAVGPGSVNAYNVSLSNLRGQADQVIPVLETAYESLPELAYLSRWTVVHILSALQLPSALGGLTVMALTPAPTPPAAMAAEGIDYVGEELRIRAMAIRGVVALARTGNGEAESTLLSCIESCEGQARTSAVQGYISYGDREARKTQLRAQFGSSIDFLLNLQTVVP